jgi:hypothetical protein
MLLFAFPSHKIIVIIVNLVCCMEVWLGAGNPAAPSIRIALTIYFLHLPYTSLADMRRELHMNTEP